ncbi:MAG: hypothetical protein AAGC93_23270 [Cyanobacteria bacterium P01_F01_bin.53]
MGVNPAAQASNRRRCNQNYLINLSTHKVPKVENVLLIASNNFYKNFADIVEGIAPLNRNYSGFILN